MGKCIGIDLGTTNSCVTAMEGGEVVVINNAEGMRTTPSVVGFSKTGERLVGDQAKRQAAANPSRTIFSVKRQMGSNNKVTIDGKKYSPQEISAMILQKLKHDAEQYLGESVTDAVITVPAYFNDSQRQATKDAGKIAGLHVKRIINEPTAAAVAYGLENEQDQKIMVYDLGGGTFDVSVIEISSGVIEVLATAGNNHLGGDDFDERLAEYVVKEYKKSEHIDLSKDHSAYFRILEAVEKAKRELSSATQTTISLPFIAMGGDGPKHLEMTITRSVFESLIHDLVEKTTQPLECALADARLKKDQIDKVLMVGGSTRVPYVQQHVRSIMKMEPNHSLNPDECVAIGAGIQAGKLSGEQGRHEVLLLDVTPLSLSIETVGGISSRLIERNTTIPTRYSQIYTTAGNFQTSVDIKVFQGERKFTRDNKLIGNFRLDGIKRARAGVPQIEVTFDIDANGIVKVSAKDLGTGREQHITITSSSNLSQEEIERATREAAMYEQQDNETKSLVEVRNDAESYIYQTEHALSEVGKTLSKETRARIKHELNALRHLLHKTKPDKMTSAQADELRRQMQKLKEEAYPLFESMCERQAEQ